MGRRSRSSPYPEPDRLGLFAEIEAGSAQRKRLMHQGEIPVGPIAFLSSGMTKRKVTGLAWTPALGGGRPAGYGRMLAREARSSGCT